MIFFFLFGFFCVFLLLALVPSRFVLLIKFFSLILSFFFFFFSLFFWLNYNFLYSGFQFLEVFDWFYIFNISFRVGLDGLSIFFVILTTFLFPICILISWSSVKYNVKNFFLYLFIIEFFVLNVFFSLDLFFFYIFFESVLIPMFILIGIWGSRERKIHAAYQFFIYTLFGSLLMLLGIIFIYTVVGSTNFHLILYYSFSFNYQLFLWLAFFVSFAVKIPMFPVHIWLPEAHVEAPTAGSVILAGILLKLGSYAFVRFLIPMFPHACYFYSPLVYTFSVIAIIFAACTTIRQIDLKKIIAYSSVVHMNYVTIGIFSNSFYGIDGSIVLMIGHGLVSGGLFMCVGMLYDRYKTRILQYYSGLSYTMPLLSLLFLFFSLANISFPGTSNFIGEFLILLSIFEKNELVVLLALFGIILSAVYVMWLYNRVFFGPLINSDTFIGIKSSFHYYGDLNKREFFSFLPLVFSILFIGLFPSPIFNILEFSVFSFLC